ncbi:MAG: hypothetical protein SGJ20_05255 [Planctomycetota bacterium]|nr:hypothetical protein [Planctomycetota bacterium]
MFSILEAVKMGLWDFEPQEVGREKYNSTRALPGTDEKLAVMAERLKMGLPLWHPSDRASLEDNEAN